MLLVEQQVSLTLFFLIKDRNRHTSDFHVAPSLLTEGLLLICLALEFANSILITKGSR